MRHPKLWWRRSGIAFLGLLLVVFLLLTAAHYMPASWLGRELFSLLTGIATGFCLLAGPMVTVDCISRERRDGTLGLLFLTSLRGYDVVFGKMVAASLDMVLCLTAMVPLLAIPLMWGGVTLLLYAYVVVALASILLLSLALGIAVSSFFTSGRIALAVLLACLVYLLGGIPLIVDQVLEVRIDDATAVFYYLFCPFYTMYLCLGTWPALPAWKFALSAGSLHALTLFCLILACWRTQTAWHDLPISPSLQRWLRLFQRWDRGLDSARAAWRRRMLPINPTAWLEGRDQLQPGALWGLLFVAHVFWGIGHLHSPHSWPDTDLVILWPLFAHYILCLWIAIQAPRRFADDKLSGALELLLCTPLQPSEMVRGSMMVLRRRFGRPLVVLMGLDVGMVWVYFNQHGWPGAFFDNDVVQLAMWGLVVFPLQAYCFARAGLYQGLVYSNSLRATFMIIWKLGLLPWVLFVVAMMTWETARRTWGGVPNITDEAAFGSWAAAHVLVCLVALAYANLGLGPRFRHLASQTSLPPWWRRWRLNWQQG